MPHTGETPGKASTNAKIAGNKLRLMKIRTGSLHARTATKQSTRKREKWQNRTKSSCHHAAALLQMVILNLKQCLF